MTKKWKKLLTFTLMLSMAMSLLNITAFAEGSGTEPEEETPFDPYVYEHTGYCQQSPHRYNVSTWPSSYAFTPSLFQVEGISGSDVAGEVYVGYCCDLWVSSADREEESLYKRLTLEEGDYYTNAQAAKIRAILFNGYWVDDEGSPLRLDALRTATGIPGLTAGEALAGTQHAVWEYANSGKDRIQVTNVCAWTKEIASANTYPLSFADETSHTDFGLTDETEGERKGYSETTKTNITAVRDYLLSLEGVQESKSDIVFSDKYFIGWEMFSAIGGTLTLRFGLEGEIAAKDQLTLTVKQGATALFQGSLLANGDALTFDEGSDSFVLTLDTTDTTTPLDLALEGTQYLENGVYLYLSKEEEYQNYVGIAEGSTPVSAKAQVALPEEEELSASVTLRKVGEKGEAVTGAKFDLYTVIKNSEDQDVEVRLNDQPLVTGADGTITVDGLKEGGAYYFKETDAPDGYVYDAGQTHTVPWPNGEVTVENGYAVGELNVSKTVAGLPTEEHFTFTIELELGDAALRNAAELVGPSFPAAWGGPYACTDGEGSPVHDDIDPVTGTLTFEKNGTVLSATVRLKDGESLTVRGIPAGTTYTITEAEDAAYTPSAWQMTGTISGVKAEAGFTNAAYRAAEVALEARKTVDGKAPGSNVFTFVLEQWNGESWEYQTRAANDAQGNVAFGKFSVTAPQDDQYYRIREVNDGGLFLYDTAPRYARLSVTEQSGSLTAAVTYYSGWDEVTHKPVSPLEAGALPLIDNEAYQSGSLYLNGYKYLDGTLSDTAFSFTLYDVTNARRQIETVRNDESGFFQFGAVTYTGPGTYVYEVRENPTFGYSCDETVYTVTVNVDRDDINGTLVVGAPAITYPNPTPRPETTEGAPAETYLPALSADSLVFRNTTESSSDDGPADAVWQLSGSKTLDGKPAEGYAFKMVCPDGREKTVTSKHDGSIAFPRQTFDEKGTYTYTVSEIAGEESGVIYDSAVYTVEVTVEKHGGNYEVTDVSVRKDGAVVESGKVVFENKTSDTPQIPGDDSEVQDDTVVPEEQPGDSSADPGGVNVPEEQLGDQPLAQVPATGDPAYLWLLLGGVSAIGLFCLTISERKRREP